MFVDCCRVASMKREIGELGEEGNARNNHIFNSMFVYSINLKVYTLYVFFVDTSDPKNLD